MNRAFSLVELSIVLVILGLLTGGILAGQSLIRAAEIRGMVTQMNNYNSAAYSFRDKYFAIPGDMSNATSFWGIAGGSTGYDNACFDVNSTSQTTCNGNGNGVIDSPAPASAVNTHSERFRSWQHLANAGLIEGSYTGRTNSATLLNQRQAGLNVPAGKISATFYDMVGYQGLPLGNSEYYPLIGGTYILPTGPSLGVFLPEEAWNMDTKLDDGKPALGAMVTFKRTSTFGPNCSTDDTTGAEYDFTIKAKNCRMLYRIM